MLTPPTCAARSAASWPTQDDDRNPLRGRGILLRTALGVTLPIAVRALVEGDEPSATRLGAAPPIVLLHGFGASSRVLAPLARHLQHELRRPVVRMGLGEGLPIHLGDVRATARRVHRDLERLATGSGFPYVDVVGHSLGGLVGAYLLKCLDRGRHVRRVVTLGTPHRGTPWALLGAIVVGAFSAAVWQMIPGSPLLRTLARLPVPANSELIALESDSDGVVPSSFACLPQAPRHANVHVLGLARISQCAVQRRRFSVGESPTRQLVAPAGSRQSGSGGNEAIEAFG